MRGIPAVLVGFVLSAVPAWAQEREDDPARVHIRLYKKVAPSIVLVSGAREKGSGVLIDRRGVILTSPTACGSSDARPQEVRVLLGGHKEVKGRVLGRDNDLELVLVKVDGSDHPALELGESEKARLGSITYVFGDSFQSIEMDAQPAISVGVLSGRYELVTRRSRSLYIGPVLETSAAVNPNQDGGALVDAQGRLLGMITLNHSDAKFAGTAIPIDRLKPAIDRILVTAGLKAPERPVVRPTPAGGREPGWLGADVEEDRDVDGLRVFRIFRRGPAERGGLAKDDVILRINQARVTTRRAFEDAVRAVESGAQVRLRVNRNGKELDIDVTLGRKVFY